MDNLSDLFDEYFNDDRCFKELIEACCQFVKEYSNITNTINELIRFISDLTKDEIDHFNEVVREMMKSYFNIEIAIPNISISINKYDYIPQGPPEEKGIKQIAFENFKYNINRYKNSKVFNFAKRFITSIGKEFIISFIMYWIFNALGMR